MPVRLRIALLFALLVFFILIMVCGSIYYFSYSERINTIKKRLSNRAITTGRLFSKREIFDGKLLLQIDSLTAAALKEKVVEIYDSKNRRLYAYSDLSKDSLEISKKILDQARAQGMAFFRNGNKEGVAYLYSDVDSDIVIVSAANDEDGKQNLGHLRNILLLSTFWGIIITVLVGYFFSGKLLRPIKRITGDVAEISVQNLTRRISTGTVQDEWFSLASTFNELLDQLQEGFELQRRFISNTSHELSTPLTSISSQLEVTLENERSTQEYRNIIESVYNDVRHMGKLTQTLLEFARASGNKGGLEINLVRIDEIVLRLPSEIAKISDKYSVLLEFDELPENEELLLVFGNETLLLAALKNIVANACKYSSDQQAVVQLTVRNHEMTVIVKDTGIGIPQNELDNIFQPFYRLNAGKDETGFGLGLSMARRIINIHKGSIQVQSMLGAGASFTIKLPSASRLPTF